jgi:hypothetical protein
MMKHKIIKLLIILTVLLSYNCTEKHSGNSKSKEVEVNVNVNGNTLRKRIPPPKGFEWVEEKPGSFAEFLQNVPLKKPGSKILDYEKRPISNQYEHVAVLDYDVGNKDLQQCADAVIRLRAEYLYKQKRFDEIKFHFTNGDVFAWNDYKNGIRPKLVSNTQVAFVKVADKDDSYKAFRKYLDTVFMYAGTISLNNETKKVKSNNAIKAGDILITPGSPGHAVIIAGRAKNKKGEYVYLLAEGYTPAQSIHVITNPFNSSINPWYRLDVNEHPTITARYLFDKTNIRTFGN